MGISKEHREARENEMRANLTTTTVGLNIAEGETNLIDYATGVQVWQSWYGASKGFAIGVPSNRTTGVIAKRIVLTLDEAIEVANELTAKAARSMARLHAAALKMNAA